MVQVREPTDIAKLHQSGALVVDAVRELPTAVGWNAEVGVPVGEPRAEP